MTKILYQKTIRFLLDDEICELSDIEPTTTVLDYLREHRRRTGTKEGCAEGDCGACTVIVAELEGDDDISLRSINSCIQFLPTLDGKALYTAESLKKSNNNQLHPVQQAMVDCHGSQCGFCTPGFIMSLFMLYKTQSNPTRRQVDDALAGNLCRCTGYRPIITAAEKMYELGENLDKNDQCWINQPCSSDCSGDKEWSGKKELVQKLRSIQRDKCLFIEDQHQYFAPLSLDELAELVVQYPQATILAGGTDVGLWVTKQHRELKTVIYIGNVSALNNINVTDASIEIGATVTLTEAYEALLEHYPEMEELYLRFSSMPIRNAGTLVGNIANGSPIGDSMPALISLGSSVTLRKGCNTREVAMDAFYLDYMKKDLAEGEFVESVSIPLPNANQNFRVYKISKRFDQDISGVFAAFCVEINGQQITDARISYGGMAAIPKRASACEAALINSVWSEATIETAIEALDKDFTPMKDMRASIEYRKKVAGNVLKKFYFEVTEPEVNVRVYSYGR